MKKLYVGKVLKLWLKKHKQLLGTIVGDEN